MSNNELFEAILTAQEEMLKHKIEANSVTLNGRRYGKLIENCPPNMKPTIFGMAVKADYALPDDYDFLVQYEPPQPKTNGDFIRSMSDYDLADWIAKILTYHAPYSYDDACPHECPLYKCCNDQPSDNIEDWLKALKDKEVKG